MGRETPENCPLSVKRTDYGVAWPWGLGFFTFLVLNAKPKEVRLVVTFYRLDSYLYSELST